VRPLRGEDITIYGDGSQTRAFCFVDDLIEGFVRMMATPDDVVGPINLGYPEKIPVRALAARVVALTASASTLMFMPLPVDDPIQHCPDTGKARATLDEGLGRTIAYFRALLG
jgi:UDP-glucuronate decarboxylase